MNKQNIKTFLTVIFVAAGIVAVLTFFGGTQQNMQSVESITAENASRDIEKMLLEAEKLAEISPAGGPMLEKQDLPANSEVEDQVFGF